MEAGKALGRQLTPSQTAGSRSLQELETGLESSPYSSGPAIAIKDANARVASRAAAASIGERAGEITSDVLQKAKTRIKAAFEAAADDIPRPVDTDAILGRHSKVEEAYSGLTNTAIAD